MEAEGFDIILSQLKAADRVAWQNLELHIETIIKAWARRERMELDWIASAEGIGVRGCVQEKVCSMFKDGLLSGLVKIECYADYKEVILDYTREILKDKFKCFCMMLSQKDNEAWQRVNERLNIYAAKWLSEKKLEAGVAKEIYQESVLILFEKAGMKNMDFDNSRDFKSYYFRILELKTMESGRKRAVDAQRSSDLEWKQLFGSLSEERYEADDTYYIVRKIMQKSISREEFYILRHYYFHSEKLSEIAKGLEISDVNCRQKKLQALRKIALAFEKIKNDRLN